jgi:N-acyl-D-amino-acid deacylase
VLDLLIANGMIIDGTGNPGFYGAVAVENETVRILRGDVSHVQAARTIDATGHVVSPGFIDMHAHTGLVILAEPHHEPKVRQGITTELWASTATPTRRSSARATSTNSIS